ncbi:MAG: hypothetical protein KBF68_11515, partial [Nitrosomonas sp.]|nr:hypothetical protein [Nitrosomonas sp.]
MLFFLGFHLFTQDYFCIGKCIIRLKSFRPHESLDVSRFSLNAALIQNRINLDRVDDWHRTAIDATSVFARYYRQVIWKIPGN